MAAINVVSWLLILGLFSHCSATNIRLNTDYRLDNILILVQNENFASVDNMKALKGYLAYVSHQMARATEAVGRRISINTVRLLVPPSKIAELKNAGVFPSMPATWESEVSADVVLENPGGKVKTIPADECYGPNKWIKMPEYTVRRNATANSFLRELSIYLWGLLSESVSGVQFYQDGSGTFQPSVCSSNMPGQYRLRNSISSGADSSSICLSELVRLENFSLAKMQEICEFTPKPSPTGNNWGSILSQPVSLFCDSKSFNNDTRVHHSSQVPNPFNRACGGLSAGEVLRKHLHFLPTTPGASVQETQPTVLLVEKSAFRDVVLVLDVSGSMSGDRIKNEIRSATIYVKYFLETGARLSIVSFSATARELQTLLKVTDDSVREQLAKKIQSLAAGGSTNISGAIYEAMSILGATAPYTKSQTGFVVLITDGEHNTGPNLTVAIEQAAKTSIVFDTISISRYADERMARLANLTNGRSTFVSENTPANVELEVSFADLVKRSVGGGENAVLLQTSAITLPTTSGSVSVGDTDILYFMISLPGTTLSTVNFTATSPTGTVYGRFSPDPGVYQIDTAVNTIVIKIPPHEVVPGTWNWWLTGASTSGRRKRSAEELLLIRRARSTSSGSLIVIGGTGSANSTVLLDTWLRVSSFPQVNQFSVQKIYAYVTNNSAPLTGAILEAMVAPSSGSPFTVQLKDDGLGADLTANDGIYVALVLPEKMTSQGDYGVTVTMTSPVSRTSTAGKFRVENVAAAPVTLPPGRITDLAVESSVKHQYVRVRFTSPGNQAYEGVPAAYEIRASNSFDQLTANFSSCALVGRITGQPAGWPLQFDLRPENLTAIRINVTFFLSAVAVSTTGVSGEPSFPMGGVLTYPAIQAGGEEVVQTEPPPIRTDESDKTDAPEQQESQWTPELIAGVAVTAVVNVAEFVAIVLVAVKF
ncbi:hypothetical protein BOX15_Mlig010915g1 [Macrostomum lignano]|uniref:VWFA domain-containing protein n=1 Tax=Macrostomum lignano TaxID=282301 RepID=A0A267FAM7_9PLAT|nr:hypothetical protein BOX15_Mlig010915g1 [Macrostomum lignano]